MYVNNKGERILVTTSNLLQGFKSISVSIIYLYANFINSAFVFVNGLQRTTNYITYKSFTMHNVFRYTRNRHN